MTLFEQSLAQLENILNKRNPNNYNIVFLGDSWVGDGHVSNNIFEEAMKKAVQYEPLLIMHGGDIVFTGAIDPTTGRNPFEFFINTVNRLNTDRHGNKVPFFVTPGNHELAPTPSGPWSIENYRNFIGPKELHFKIDLPKFNFTLVSLNTLYHFVRNEYGLTDSELDFLEDSLRDANRNTFVAMHVPPEEPRFDWVGSDAFPNGRGRTRFYEIIDGKVSKVLVSHIHDFQLATKFLRNKNGFSLPLFYAVDFILSGGGGATLNVGEINHIVVLNIKNNAHGSIITPKLVPVGWTRAVVD